MFKRPTIRIASALLFTLLAISFLSCTTIDLYEKISPIPAHKWKSSFRPSFTFAISDTAVPYNIYIVLRHNNKYNYNNLWVTLHTKAPDGKVASAQYELPLATNEKGWLGTGMDDLYEHRIALTPLNERFFFSKGGTYTFTLEHIMREDPLENVMNAGLRIEKKR